MEQMLTPRILKGTRLYIGLLSLESLKWLSISLNMEPMFTPKIIWGEPPYDVAFKDSVRRYLKSKM